MVGVQTTERADLLVTVREAAEMMAVSERTLWQLTNSGELPAVKIGRCVRYAVDDLKVFIERQKTVGGAK